MKPGNSEIALDGPYLDILLLSRKGYCCSQIVAKLILRDLGRENAELVRSMAALCYGIGYSGGTCGVLTGAACALSAALGSDELQSPALPSRLSALMRWFDDRAKKNYGGVRCEEIMAASPDKRACSELMTATLEQVQLLVAQDEGDGEGEGDGHP